MVAALASSQEDGSEVGGDLQPPLELSLTWQPPGIIRCIKRGKELGETSEGLKRCQEFFLKVHKE